MKPRSINRFSHGYQEHAEETSTSTRSVLDALKEISRKRIHASEVITLFLNLSTQNHHLSNFPN